MARAAELETECEWLPTSTTTPETTTAEPSTVVASVTKDTAKLKIRLRAPPTGVGIGTVRDDDDDEYANEGQHGQDGGQVDKDT